MTTVAQRQAAHGLANDVPQSSKVLYLLAAASLTVRQQVVRATANTATGDYTVTLPPVADAAGLIFFIVSIIANSKTITVTDAGDESQFSDLTLDTTDDHAILISDGLRWYVVHNGIV